MTRVALAVLGVAAALTAVLAAVLAAALIGLEATHHEGYRPDQGDLVGAALLAASVVAAVAACAAAARPGRARLPVVVGAAVLFTAAVVAADAVLYRYVVPLPADLRQPVSWWPGAAYPTAAALVGFGAGRLLSQLRPTRSPSTGPAPASQILEKSRAGFAPRIVAGVVLALAGAFAVPEYTRIALELATDRFSTDVRAGLGGPRIGLTAGRYALYGHYGDTRRDCPLTDSAGRRIDVVPPAVPFTDNSDGIVAAMLGTFTLDEASEIIGECRSDDFWVAGPPVIKGPLGRALSTPPGVLFVLGALPGVLVIGLFLVRVRKKSGSPSNPGHQPNG